MKQIWVIDYHGPAGAVPKFILEMMRDLWADFELGNDFCYLSGDSAEDHPEYDNFVTWLADKSLKPEDVLLHFWW